MPLIALSYDDGPSSYRPALLRLLRDRDVHATFFDTGVRAEANPQLGRFQLADGHVVLNHSYTHPHFSNLALEQCHEEVLRNETALAAVGAPLSFRGIAVPYADSTPDVEALLKDMAYTHITDRIGAEDWLPSRTAAQIADDLVRQLSVGAVIALHDGPIDTTAGAGTVSATALVIDAARSMGYDFGVLAPDGTVVASSNDWSGEEVPDVVAPVPFHQPLTFGESDDLPEPWVAMT